MEKRIIEKTCKKCKKILPEGYKYKRCEACRTAQVQRVKEIGGTILAVGTIVVPLVMGVANKHKKDNES